MTVCLTVHHEAEAELERGVSSFENSSLPFHPSKCRLVYIVDGLKNRSGEKDAQQRETVIFLLSRLYGVKKEEIDGELPTFNIHTEYNPTVSFIIYTHRNLLRLFK